MAYLKKIFRSLLSPYQGIHYTVWILMSAIFTDALGQMVSIFMPLYLRHLGYSIQSIGFLISIYGVGGIIGAYLGGELSDRIGPLKILVTSLIINSFILLIFMTIKDLNILFLIGFSLGIFQHVFRPASLYILTKGSESSDRTRLIGLRRVTVNLGISVAGTLGGWLASIDFEYIFFCDAFISALTAISLIFTGKALMSHLNHNSPSNDNSPSSDFPIYSRKLWLYMFILFINSCVFFQLNSTFPLYLQSHYHMSLKEYSYIYTLSCLVIILFEVPLLNYTKKYNTILLAAFGSLFNCGSLSILPLSNHMSFAFISAFCWTIGEILFFPVILNLIFSSTSRKQGRIIGIQQCVYILGKLFGPLIGTTILEVNGGKLLWYSCGMVGIFSCLLLIYAQKRFPDNNKF